MPEAKDDATESVPKMKRVGKQKRRSYTLIGSVLVGLGLVLGIAVLPDRIGSNVVLAGQNFKVEVAATHAQQQQGLSGRAGLGTQQGLLFLFQDPELVCFWMKDMKFDIDILWFDEHRHLIHQARNVSPETYPKEYCPPKAAKYVLEVPAGTADRLSLQNDSDLEVNL